MTEGIIIAIVTGGLAVLGNILVAATSNSKTLYRIEQLEKGVQKHNNLIERTYKLESDLKTAFFKIDECKEELRDLKH